MVLDMNYAKATEHNMRGDAEKALQYFLSASEGDTMTVFPQTLNPVLKTLESLGIWEQAVVLPFHDDRDRPMYVIMKLDKGREVANIQSVVSTGAATE